VALPEFRLEDRVVEALAAGESDFWVVVPAFDEAANIETVLASLARQSDSSFVVCVVDNGSTDGTGDVVRSWSAAHPSRPLRLVLEPDKGVGAAADTGFRVALAAGAIRIARTDADCVAARDWVASLRSSLDGGLDLVGGRTIPRRDESPLRPGEAAVIETLVQAAALVARVRRSNNGRGYRTRFRICMGLNLAVRGSVYEAAGGFPRSRMDEVHEDRALVNRVRRISARIGTNRDALVATSIRRLRAYGYVGTLRWYYDQARPSGPVDVR
jgi:glycosyltransferase involved in cell wall biosynthesis